MTWKTAGQLVRETVARLERKGLGAVADTAPSQVRAGGIGAGQTVDGGSRVIGIRWRAFPCFAAHVSTGWRDLTFYECSMGMFPRDSARVTGGDCQPVFLVIVFHVRGHRRIAAASFWHAAQRSGA